MSSCLATREAEARRAAKESDAFVEVACPACQQTNRRHLFDKYGFKLQQCTACLTAYVSPRPDFDWLIRYYSDSKAVNDWLDMLVETEAERRRAQFEPRARRLREVVERLEVATSTLVDVGAATGTFCDTVREMELFSRVVAVDTNERAAELCASKGLETIAQPLEKVGLEARADVLTAYEVIEHVFEPIEFLRACRDVMEPGGLLVLTTPNFLGFDVMVLGEQTENIVPPDHLNYFNPRSLQTLLERGGFSLVEVETPGRLDVQIVQRMLQSGTVDLSAQPFLEHVLSGNIPELAERFQQFLADNGLSSHMWAVARKG